MTTRSSTARAAATKSSATAQDTRTNAAKSDASLGSVARLPGLATRTRSRAESLVAEAVVMKREGSGAELVSRDEEEPSADAVAVPMPAPTTEPRPPSPSLSVFRLSSSNPTTPSPIEEWPWEKLTSSFPDLFYNPASPSLPMPLPLPRPRLQPPAHHSAHIPFISPFSTSPHSHPTETLAPAFWELDRDDADFAVAAYPTPRSDGDDDVEFGKNRDADMQWAGDEGWPDGEQAYEREETLAWDPYGDFERELM